MLAGTDHVCEVGTEDEGVVVGIGQVIGVGGGPIDEITAEMRRNHDGQSGPL